MDRALQSPAEVESRSGPEENESGLFSIESVLNLEKSIFAGSPLSEVLTNIAQLVESQAEGMLCTIWLPIVEGYRTVLIGPTLNCESYFDTVGNFR